MPDRDRESEKKIKNVTADMTAAIVALLLGLAIFGAFINDILNWYSGFLETLYSGGLTKLKNWVTAIFFPLDLLLLGLVVFTLRRYNKLTRVPPQSPEPQREEIVSPQAEVKRQWEHVRELANSSSPSDWNMAILRADALLDEILQSLGYAGTTLAERLKVVDPHQLPSVERVWSAHRLRNTIVHGPTEDHARETMIHALRSYELALKELGMMEANPVGNFSGVSDPGLDPKRINSNVAGEQGGVVSNGIKAGQDNFAESQEFFVEGSTDRPPNLTK